MPRGLILALAIAAAAASCSGSCRGAKPAAATAPASGGPATPFATAPTSLTSQQSITSDIRHLGLTPERAKQLFSLTVGPLPGVSIEGLTKDPHDFDGTQAIEYLYQEWANLTPEQRRVADALIRVSGSGARGGDDRPAPSARRDRPPTVLLASFLLPIGNTPAHDYDGLAKNANNTLSERLGVSPVREVVDVSYGKVSTASEYAHALSWWRPFDSPHFDYRAYSDGCHVTVWDQKMADIDDISAAAILTHEMMHCYQDRVAGTYEVRASQHAWVADGEATWAMAAIVPSASQIIETKWTPYVYGPKIVYSDRGYDAIGVFGHLGDVTGPSTVWSRLLSVADASAGGNDAGAFAALIQGTEVSYYSSWGASYFQAGHDQWQISGPGQPPASGPAPSSISVSSGTDEALAPAPSDQASLFTVDASADIIVVALLTGYGRLHDQGFGIDTPLYSSAPLALCLKQGGCTCQDDTEGDVIETQPATAPLSIGIDGGDSTAQVGLAGHSLDEFCKKKKKKDSPAPQSPRGGGRGGGAGGGGGDQQAPDKSSGDGQTEGDPHMTSFDGARFDFQSVGEYTLTKSTKDDFNIQVRQVPVLASKSVALNQAMATTVGGHRVMIGLENSVNVLRVDGAIVAGEPPKFSAGSITRALTGYGVAYVLEWPDGTIVHVQPIGRFGINVDVHPAASRRGTLEGLLGNDDGVAGNDEKSVDTLADRWRVDQAASLFTYLPGQSAATFVDKTFPDSRVDAATVPNRAAAEQDCRESGVTDPQLLSDCVLDLAVTNGFLFKNQYAHEQSVLVARAALKPPPVAGASAQPVLIMAGTIVDKSVQPEFHFTARQDDVVLINPPDCSDTSDGHTVAFVMLDPKGAPIGTAHPGCQMGRYALPLSGTYTIKGNLFKTETGTYRIPIRFVRHDSHQATGYGQIVSGSIGERAAHDLWTFAAHAGDVIQVSGKGCELGGMVLGVIDPKGTDRLGPFCRDDTAMKLTMTGTYTLIVNDDERGPASYQFVLQGVSGISK